MIDAHVALIVVVDLPDVASVVASYKTAVVRRRIERRHFFSHLGDPVRGDPVSGKLLTGTCRRIVGERVVNVTTRGGEISSKLCRRRHQSKPSTRGADPLTFVVNEEERTIF